MRVIFLKDIKNVGRIGEIKEVSDGYVKNFLLPKGFVKAATKSAVREIESRKEKNKKEEEYLKSELGKIEASSKANPILIKVKVGERGEVFGGIRESDIEKALNESGYAGLQIEKLERPIKAVGIHRVKMKLGKGVGGEIIIEVKPS